METKSEKIAVWLHVEYDFESVGGTDMERLEGYIRISEYVDVEFEQIQTDLNAVKIKVFEDKKADIRAAAQAKVNTLDRKIQELLAIGHDNE